MPKVKGILKGFPFYEAQSYNIFWKYHPLCHKISSVPPKKLSLHARMYK